jgi:hypothetical protein
MVLASSEKGIDYLGDMEEAPSGTGISGGEGAA